MTIHPVGLYFCLFMSGGIAFSLYTLKSRKSFLVYMTWKNVIKQKYLKRRCDALLSVMTGVCFFLDCFGFYLMEIHINS